MDQTPFLSPPHGARATTFLVAAFAGLLLVSACGAPPTEVVASPIVDSRPPTTGQAPSHGQHGAPGGPSTSPELWAVQTGPLGVVISDATGQMIYRSDRDSNSPSSSRCDQVCGETWPPVLTTGDSRPLLLGIDEGKVGTVARSDGTTQVTVAGWPIYRHTGDTPGLTTPGGHGTDGLWYVITPTGDKAG